MIVDDEPISRTLLQHYVSQFPELSLTGVFEDGIAALEAFEANQASVLFLDINMHEMTGLELAHAVGGRAHIVFTTASREYGPEAFALNAVDYLVKPITIERFRQAVGKLQKLHEDHHAASGTVAPVLLVKDVRSLIRVPLDEVQVIEALGDYLKIHTAHKFYTMLGTMKQMEKKLAPNGFIRVHRSYLVNVNSILSVQANQIVAGEHTVPVSDTFKPALKALLKAS
jgi:DNA-binding LytR/AlgR family response regulator